MAPPPRQEITRRVDRPRLGFSVMPAPDRRRLVPSDAMGCTLRGRRGGRVKVTHGDDPEARSARATSSCLNPLHHGLVSRRHGVVLADALRRLAVPRLDRLVERAPGLHAAHRVPPEVRRARVVAEAFRLPGATLLRHPRFYLALALTW